MRGYFELRNEIDSVIRSIITNQNTEIPRRLNETTGDIFPTSGQIGEWDHNIKRKTNEFIAEFQKKSNLIASNELDLILNYLLKLEDLSNNARQLLLISTAENYELTNAAIDKVNQHLDNPLDLDSLELTYNDKVNLKDIKYIYDEVKNHINFDEQGEIFVFIQSTTDQEKLKFISMRLLDLYELCRLPTTKAQSSRIKQITKQIEDSANISNSVTQVQEIAQQFKENVSKLTSDSLLRLYNTEAIKLDKQISRLNNWIIFCIIVIILIMCLKLIFIIVLSDFFKDIWNFSSFVLLVFSFSALITYLIKDRNRLIKLHNHYNLNSLELAALPSYMGELDPAQRKDLYINLAPNYFRGIYPENSKNDEPQKEDLESITKDINNIQKILQETKNLKS